MCVLNKATYYRLMIGGLIAFLYPITNFTHRSTIQPHTITRTQVYMCKYILPFTMH